MDGVDVDVLKAALEAEKRERHTDAQRLRAVRRARKALGGGTRKKEKSQVQSELREALRNEMPNAAAYFSSAQAAFRQGIAARQKALSILATFGLPALPTFERVETPFLIWDLRNGSQGTDLLLDSHLEAGSSWAKAYSHYDSDGPFLVSDELNFYFFWQNPHPSDVVINVESFLMVTGDLHASANAGWIWSPFWGQGTIGESSVTVNAQLSLLQWWDQPPTQPMRQAAQVDLVGSVDCSGGFALLSPGSDNYLDVIGNHHVHYDTFWVPSNAAVVFEVGLRMGYSGNSGGGSCDFESPGNQVTCPYLQIEYASSPQPVMA